MPATQNARKFAISRFEGSVCLFPLDRSGRFRRNIVNDAVNALDLVDDAHGDAVEHIVRNARPVGGHEVRRCDTAQRERIVIRRTS